jgi:hypothetical protein
MTDSAKKPKRPRDPNQLAKLITDIATGDAKDVNPDEGKNPHAVALGRAGGLKGGKARAKSLSPDKRKEIAKRAAKTRWGAVAGQAKKERQEP